MSWLPNSLFSYSSFSLTTVNFYGPQIKVEMCIWEVQWPSGRASDSGARGWGFDPHSGRHVVSLSKIH